MDLKFKNGISSILVTQDKQEEHLVLLNLKEEEKKLISH